MSSTTMEKAYNPNDFENKIYEKWMKEKKFQPSTNPKTDESFVVVIPPPNVTGVLHMGHGLNNSLQDIVVRYQRMLGKKTLWVPGTDHAGIATQHVVERKLREQGKDRHQLGREEFVKYTWQVKEEHHSIITKQLQKIGASCDWSRERFTLDDGLSDAVREVFVNLYEKDLIYKGKYLVNWCSSCGTALADDEVDYAEENGKLYRIKYPFADGKGFIEIATTRPETMFGDTAVAVNPEDARYSGLDGRMLKLPLTDREIPVIKDSYVDIEYGSGAVKITPAHDPNDWEVGNRHNLEKINILTDDGKMNENTPVAVRGLSVKEARDKSVELLEAEGLLIEVKDLPHQVGHCYRCSTIIEPYMSAQWFVKMKPLADKALKALHDGDINFYPKKWENTYIHWMENIRDWCISRQLWWGHRIPVWYCNECGHMMVERKDPSKCSKCSSKSISQEEDVLDTWFSSWLWPFSTLGWPEKSKDFEEFYPTSTLVTAYDIIFFWVARMIMAGLEFTGQVPFKDIYIHQLVRDKQGRKMSKSLGNGIDPLEIVSEYGADSLKFTLAFMAAQGQDVLIDSESFKLGSKFANKIWNASRYILMNLPEDFKLDKSKIDYDQVDTWILHRLNQAVLSVDQAMAVYRYNDAAKSIYDFFWNDFCDWYIEASKLKLYSNELAKKESAQNMLVYLLIESLKLLHPFLPFITEEIYSKIPNCQGMLIDSDYPRYIEENNNEEISLKFNSLQELVRGIRTVRSEFTIPPERKISVAIKTDDGFAASDFFHSNKQLVASFINTSELQISSMRPDTEGSIAVAGNGYEAFIYVRDLIDVPKEIEKLKKESEKVGKLLSATQGKLKNSKFVDNAPADVIEKERSKLQEFTSRVEKISEYLRDLT
ncbi:MAG: valine--tRNA ligase [Spirochaetales bacterium]|nr:valine--tRNA ligase [Spirochaetales bacterium]